ncbi:MAG: polysaccharide lyase family 7 protein [Aeromicrobium sp.]
MEFLRSWLPSVVIGILVPLVGLGVAGVSGLPVDRPQVTRPIRPVSRPSPAPASVEAFSAPPIPEPVAPPAPPAAARPHRAPSPPEPPAEGKAPEPAPAPAASPPPPATPPPPVPAPPPSLPVAVVPSPPPPAAPSPAPITVPGQVVNLSPWKLTLPVGPKDHPLEVRQPELASFSDPEAFRLDGVPPTGVAFRARVGGVTTKNSHYPRSELREMTADGSAEAAWSNAAGTHVMTITEAITALPAGKPHVVAGQVHDADDDVVMIRLEAGRLFVEADGHDAGVLDPAYQLGTRFTVEVSATPAGIKVTYNGVRTVDVPVVRSGLYFKAGCYTQSNPSRGDSPDAYGEVVIYGLTVTHG